MASSRRLTKVPASYQVITRMGNNLDDEANLNDNGIGKGDILRTTAIIRGGAFTEERIKNTFAICLGRTCACRTGGRWRIVTLSRSVT